MLGTLPQLLRFRLPQRYADSQVSWSIQQRPDQSLHSRLVAGRLVLRRGVGNKLEAATNSPETGFTLRRIDIGKSGFCARSNIWIFLDSKAASVSEQGYAGVLIQRTWQVK